MTNEKIKRNVQKQSAEITAVKRCESALAGLTPAAQHRVFGFVWGSITEKLEAQRAAAMAGQTKTEVGMTGPRA